MKTKPIPIFSTSLIIGAIVIYPLLYWLTITRQTPIPVLRLSFPDKIEPSNRADILKALMDSKPAIIFQETDTQNFDTFSRLFNSLKNKLPINISASIISTDAFNANNGNVSMDDLDLIATIRKTLIPPSTKRYNFQKSANYKPGANPSAGQVQAVKDILEKFGPNGFYIECGANDGERMSNSLWLESSLKWEGLLIEADPTMFKRLKAKNRKAWLGGFCLSDTTYAKNTSYYVQKKYNNRLGSGLIRSKNYDATQSVPAQCFPLYSVLLALNRTTVDFFSLDVEGSEMEILKTIPFDKILIKIITVEHLIIKEGKLGLRKFMEDKGFIFYRTVVTPTYSSGDSIFIHKSIQLSEEQKSQIGVEDSGVTKRPR